MIKLRSISTRLLVLVLAVLTSVLVLLGAISSIKSYRELQELADGRLAESARTLQALVEQGAVSPLRSRPAQNVVLPSSPANPSIRTYEAEVGYQVFDQNGQMLISTSNLAGLPPPSRDDAGYRDITQGKYKWRLFTQPADAQRLIIRTGERNDSRRDIRRALLIEHVVPLLVGLPILALLIAWAVRQGLSPLRHLAELLRARSPGSREPVQIQQPPLELQPVIDALNAQLKWLEDALERERRFSADVAHELRTPLSSAMINLGNAEATLNSGDARAAMLGAHNSLDYLARRVEQLLALARIENSAGEMQPVDLVALTGNVIEELSPLIASSNIDLGVEFSEKEIVVDGHAGALGALLRNLIENALRHVPSGGQVQLSIVPTASFVNIDVADDGEGIPPERRAAVFARFHREEGSRGEGYGLGLSIVERAARLHGASLELLDSPFGHGLRVHVQIPR